MWLVRRNSTHWVGRSLEVAGYSPTLLHRPVRHGEFLGVAGAHDIVTGMGDCSDQAVGLGFELERMTGIEPALSAWEDIRAHRGGPW